MSLYKFKSSRCSPCNQSTQRRRKVYHCWISSSPINVQNMKHANTMSTITVELIHHRCQIFTTREVRRLLSEVNSSYLLTSRPGTMKGHVTSHSLAGRLVLSLGTRTCQPVLRGRRPQRHPGNSEVDPTLL